MPHGKWVAFEGFDAVHNCRSEPSAANGRAPAAPREKTSVLDDLGFANVEVAGDAPTSAPGVAPSEPRERPVAPQPERRRQKAHRREPGMFSRANPPEEARSKAGPSESAKSDCFIATAALKGRDDDLLARLRTWRDARLLTRAEGRLLCALYYAISPPIAAWIATQPRLRELVRSLIWRIARVLRVP